MTSKKFIGFAWPSKIFNDVDYCWLNDNSGCTKMSDIFVQWKDFFEQSDVTRNPTNYLSDELSKKCFRSQHFLLLYPILISNFKISRFMQWLSTLHVLVDKIRLRKNMKNVKSQKYLHLYIICIYTWSKFANVSLEFIRTMFIFNLDLTFFYCCIIKFSWKFGMKIMH